MPNIGFQCIKEEADLMCELLKHGAKPSDDIIQLSSVIRMCALSLVYLREPQSIASAAAMVVSALPPSCLPPICVPNFNKYIYPFLFCKFTYILTLVAK